MFDVHINESFGTFEMECYTYFFFLENGFLYKEKKVIQNLKRNMIKIFTVQLNTILIELFECNISLPILDVRLLQRLTASTNNRRPTETKVFWNT